MSLNCLSCQRLQRSDSDRDNGQPDYMISDYWKSPERSWSGNLSYRPPSRPAKGEGGGGGGGLRAVAEKTAAGRKGHRRLHSTGGVDFGGPGKEPRLIRSSGMRRDWSFEDLTITIKESTSPIS